MRTFVNKIYSHLSGAGEVVKAKLRYRIKKINITQLETVLMCFYKRFILFSNNVTTFMREGNG